MQGYIYFVGKAYPLPEAIADCRRLGYKIGLFLDKNITLKNPGDYDSVIEVDFSSTQAILDSVDLHSIEVSGLVCTYENYLVGKSILAEHFKIAAPSVASARMCTDKYLMRQAFMQADPDITPLFGLISSQDEILKLANRFGYPLIIKPTSLVKSLLVIRCNDEAELIKNYTYAVSRVDELYKQYNIYDRKPQLIVEQYITGKACSIAAFVDAEGVAHFCEGVVELTTAQDIGIEDNYLYNRRLPADFTGELTERIFDVATKGIKALEMRSTPAHVELIYNDNEVKLIEIGARIGGYRPRMYNYSYDLDLIEQEIRLALGQKPELSAKFQAYCGVFELFPVLEGKFSAIENAPENTDNYAYFRIKTKVGQQIGPAKNGYKAAAIIIVTSNDIREYNDMCQAIDSIAIKVLT
jgi:S-sulfo-L-cysteine synthase (3-phospho-L-serine-dependent)